MLLKQISLKKQMVAFIGIVVFLPWSLLLLFCDPGTLELELMDAHIADLQLQLEQLQSVNNRCEVDVRVMAHHMSRLITGPAPWENRTLPAWSQLSVETQLLVHRLSSPRLSIHDTPHAVALNMPSVFSFLPHLLKSPDSLLPAYQLSRGKIDAKLVIGMSTVPREKTSYLVKTLHELFHAMAPDEEDMSVIVLLIAETDLFYVMKVVKELKSKFDYQLETGLLELIAPPASYYPDLTNSTPTLGDSRERFEWRAKQALDYAFLMAYAQSKGMYYLQLEDDIAARPGFVTDILDAISQKQIKKKKWFVMDFCAMGFIGKMFRSSDLHQIIQFLVMFYADKPVDWILDALITTKACSSRLNQTICNEKKNSLWSRHGISLFEHVGLHSSLPSKSKRKKLKNVKKYKQLKKKHKLRDSKDDGYHDLQPQDEYVINYS